MGMSGHAHAQAGLPLGKKLLALIEWGVRWMQMRQTSIKGVYKILNFD
jgi:hypothetical protein